MATTHPFLAGSGPLAFAHRGGAAAGDENTIAAFTRAVQVGYRHLETDVHATSDGVAVIFHDATTDRMLGRPGRIEDLTWADLRSVRVAGQRAVPRLDEVLTAFAQVRLNIDVKADAAVDATVEVIRRTGVIDRVLLASFRDERLARIRRALGERVATSLGQRDAARLWAASRVGHGARRLAGSAVAAQMPYRIGPMTVVDRRFVRYAHQVGLPVHVWTVDDPDAIRGLLDAGVDGIMTDHIDVLRDVYTERGLWPA